MKIVAGPRAQPIVTSEPATASKKPIVEPQLAERARLAQRLGVNEPSKMISLLGKDRFVELRAVNVPGKIAWVNFDLAKAHGFPVPDSRKMTPELERALLEALAFRVLKPDEDAGDRTTTSVFADRYKGTGMGKNEGSGRAAFLPTRNLHIKGVGLTPLAKVESSDFTHSHGGAPMREGFLEAIWGEVGDNLFTHGSTQVLAVIDIGDHTQWEDGSKEKRALIIRAGRQLRPAHLMSSLFRAGEHGVETFVKGMRDAGDCVEKDGVPDLYATMKRVVDRHALTAAEQYRHRVLHGAISTSNLELDGSQLDLGTQTSQPRTAPIKVIRHGSQFGTEHEERAKELQAVYDALRQSLPAKEQKRLNARPLDVRKLLDDVYDKQLAVQLTGATGLPSEIARTLAGTTELPRVIRELAKLSHVPVADADKSVSEKDAVVDVFALLRSFPPVFFAEPKETLSQRAFELLQPIFREDDPALAARVRGLCDRFVDAYGKLMTAARAQGVTERQITNRARFENAPLDKLYRARLNATLQDAIDRYERSGSADIFKDAVDVAISSSMRSVERLKTQGTTNGKDTQLRTIAGVDYGVRVDGADRSLRVSLKTTALGDGRVRLDSLDGAPVLTREQVASLRYRFTTDDWKGGAQEAAAKIEDGAIVFEVPMLADEIGRLEGVFYATKGEFWLKDRSSNFSGYVFAIP